MDKEILEILRRLEAKFDKGLDRLETKFDNLVKSMVLKLNLMNTH